jgi:hypothetical protein
VVSNNFLLKRSGKKEKKGTDVKTKESERVNSWEMKTEANPFQI